MILDQETDDRIDDMIESQKTNLERYKHICELAGYRVDGVYELLRKAYRAGAKDGSKLIGAEIPVLGYEADYLFDKWLQQR